jgi:hypothetical protein
MPPNLMAARPAPALSAYTRETTLNYAKLIKQIGLKPE